MARQSVPGGHGLRAAFTLIELLVTAGPWTKAGGALPEDWPQWMRRFRDY